MASSNNVQTNVTENGYLELVQGFLGVISIDLMLFRGSDSMRLCYVGLKCSTSDTGPLYWGGSMSFV
jgi:hypothetical protein